MILDHRGGPNTITRVFKSRRERCDCGRTHREMQCLLCTWRRGTRGKRNVGGLKKLEQTLPQISLEECSPVNFVISTQGHTLTFILFYFSIKVYSQHYFLLVQVCRIVVSHILYKVTPPIFHVTTQRHTQLLPYYSLYPV